MNDEPLRHTSTHAATETDGRAFGLDLTRLIWVVLALGAGLVPGWLLSTVLSLPVAACIIFGPALVVTIIQFVLLQDKPPGWFINWLDTRLTGGHLTPLRPF